MGGGNAQKSKMAREKNLEKQRAAAKGNLAGLYVLDLMELLILIIVWYVCRKPVGFKQESHVYSGKISAVLFFVLYYNPVFVSKIVK